VAWRRGSLRGGTATFGAKEPTFLRTFLVDAANPPSLNLALESAGAAGLPPGADSLKPCEPGLGVLPRRNHHPSQTSDASLRITAGEVPHVESPARARARARPRQWGFARRSLLSGRTSRGPVPGACPVSTGGGTRRVQLVREGGGAPLEVPSRGRVRVHPCRARSRHRAQLARRGKWRAASARRAKGRRATAAPRGRRRLC